MLEYDPTRVALYSPEQRPTLFESGREYTDTQLSIEAARLAYVRAEQSAAEKQRLAEDMSRVGFASLEVFDHEPTHTQAFAAFRSIDQTALVAFRGTQPDSSGDLKIDLRARLISWPESAGRVHEGFATAFRSVRNPIESWLRVHDSRRKFILTGHSLGAALATVAASVWRPSLLVTLGSPRVGDAEFVHTLAEIDALRIVDCCDLVTDVPPVLLGYSHAGPATYITRKGEIISNPDRAVIAADRFQADAEYLQRYAWKITENVLTRRLADHAPINYARAFFDP